MSGDEAATGSLTGIVCVSGMVMLLSEVDATASTAEFSAGCSSEEEGTGTGVAGSADDDSLTGVADS